MTVAVLSHPRVLIVDDDAAMRAMLQDALMEVGCTVVEAASGTAGLAAFQVFQPDVVLLDALMPGMDGFTACGLIRAMPDGATIPIMIITGLDDDHAIDRAFAAGATDFVTKPFRLNVLQHRVRRLAEAQQAQALLHVRDRAIAATSNGVIITDARQPDNPIISVNPAVENLTGYTADQLLGRNCRFLQGALTDPLTSAALRQAISGGYAIRAEILNYHQDGTTFWNDLAITPVRDSWGSLTHFVGVQQDITQRKQMEQALRTSEERFRLLFEHSPDAIWLLEPHEHDIPWSVVDCNPAACEMHGYTREELLGKPTTFFSVAPEAPERRKHDVELLAQFVREGRVQGESLHRRKDGTVIHIEYTDTLVIIDERELVLGIDKDITERKHAEYALERLAERLRHLHAIARAIQAVQPSPTIVATTLHQVRLLIACWWADLALIDDLTGETTVLAVDTEGDTVLQPGDDAPLEVLGLRPELRAGNVVHIDDIMNIANLSPELQMLQSQGTRSLLVVPLIAQQVLIGALKLGAKHPGQFGEEDIAIAREVADLLAVALHNTQVYGREQHARRVAEALQAASLDLTQSLDLPIVLHHLLEHVALLLPYDSANVMLLDAHGYLVFTTGHGYKPGGVNSDVGLRFDPRENAIFGTLISEQRSILIPDTEANPEWEQRISAAHVRNWLGVPLIVAGQVIGVYSVDKAVPRFFTAEHVKLAEAFAPHAALAVENSRLFAALKTGRERQQRLSQQLLEVQERERRHLARELHDQIGQMLTAIKMNLQLLGRSGHDQRLDDTMNLVGQVLAEVRDLSLELRPPMLDDFGLVSALRWYIDREAQRAGYAATLDAEELEGRLPPDLETTCYRIVQESLTNVARHSGASAVAVTVRQVADELMLTVHDNGTGFDVQAAQERARSGNSLGLLSIRERAELVGGTIEIQSFSGIGTTVRSWFPFDGLPDEV